MTQNTIVPLRLISPRDFTIFDPSDPYGLTDMYPVLSEIVRAADPVSILEIGVRFGYSLGVALDAAPRCRRAVGCDNNTFWDIGDMFIEGQQNLTALLKEGRWPSVESLEFHLIDTQSVARLPFDGPFDYAYVDADHTPQGCLHDIELVLPLMAEGGVIVADDVDSGGLRPYVEKWARLRGFPTAHHPDQSGRGRLVIRILR